MVMPKLVIMHLITSKRKPISECHDKVLDLMDNVLLNDTLINFLFVHTQFLNVDEIEKVLVLEHLNGAEGLFIVWYGGKEVIGEFALIMVEVLLLNDVTYIIRSWLVIVTVANVEYTLVQVLGIVYYSNMMRETNTQELHQRKIVEIRQSKLTN